MGEGRGAQLYSGRQKLFTLLRPDHPASSSSSSSSSPSSSSPSPSPSPVATDEDLSDKENDRMSPAWNYHPSPYVKSPWSRELQTVHQPASGGGSPACALVGSMVREEGHVYSLAAGGGLLYTGSDSKNIRVWKEQREFSGFKSSSGLVKAIVVAGGKIYTGHQDGKIRVWRASANDLSKHRRVGTLPTLREVVKSSLNPQNYVQVRRRRSSVWVRHFDAVSCLSVEEEEGLLYSGSWDKTVKVWRLTDSKCLESIAAHDDAVNTVVAPGFDSLVMTGSADGTVKVWRREASVTSCRHVLEEVLKGAESPAVTALAVCRAERVVYGGSSDGSVNVWERKGKRMVAAGALRGHKLAVLCVAAAGSLVFSGGADKTICVWRRDGGVGRGHSWVAALSGHGGPVKCLAVEEEEEDDVEGRRRWVLYSGSLDRSVKVWKVVAVTAGEVSPAMVKEKTTALPLVG